MASSPSPILTAVALAALASACAQDTGEGPITVTHEVRAGYEEFQRASNPMYFAISTDGQAYGYAFCPDLNCRAAASRALAIRACEGRSKGTPCRIYADRNGVVWDGPETVGLSPLSKTAPPIPKEGASEPVTLAKCRLPDGYVLAMVPERCRSVGGEVQ